MKHEYAILEQREGFDYKIFTIDVKNAKYNGIPWLELGDTYKRKFETLLLFLAAPKRLHVNYAFYA